MKLSVYVLGREVAVLESVGDFKSLTTYLPQTQENDFISLTMPVRPESYPWDDQLPPVLQMNLPEGYLLQVLQEQFGPLIGASPLSLLSVIGRNMIGRIQIAAPGVELGEPPQPIEVKNILQGDNSEEAFAALVRQHATSGVSGVLPKFLDQEEETTKEGHPKNELGRHQKATLLTRRHIIKGSSERVPFAALNEYLCMQVVSKVLPSAKTEVSQDGQALVVHRFDVDQNGQPFWGMEDFCALLGLRPAQKYETTWERIARAVREQVPGARQYETFKALASILMLTYALKNADCHAKNIALLYTSREDVHLAPAYDFLTTTVYAGYQNNPPGISFLGKKTWTPGKNLQKFIATTFGIPLKEQNLILEAISDAVADTVPLVEKKRTDLPLFRGIGKRMLLSWQEGVESLRNPRVYASSEWPAQKLFEGLSDAPPLNTPRTPIGRSPLLGVRSGVRRPKSH
ncbi:type II toxin-antitoxin system HipA family toxin [Granulicella sp. L46]|uniref:type II toxin-antitoxin system HipA family toxin n=1 Tax=Granulicella sp. L46 TaxID=1641865 RepID=UPI00131ECA55|nr:type II toxin-antitoxin system HipA family toxin [Granulicella sp. L46]